MEKQTIEANGNTYRYVVIRKNIKSIRLTVEKDLYIKITAPHDIADRKIKAFILDNLAFIDKYIEKRRAAAKRHFLKDYKTGEYFLLFGERINIVTKTYPENKIFLENDTLYMLLKENTRDEREKRFDLFIKKIAINAFGRMMDEYFPNVSNKIKSKPSITVRKMKTKWGSANPARNKITLNTALVYAPKDLIGYVLIHELCHFYHLNHSKAFYNQLLHMMPDYKQKRKTLRETYGFLI